jgi:hypothetical protein
MKLHSTVDLPAESGKHKDKNGENCAGRQFYVHIIGFKGAVEAKISIWESAGEWPQKWPHREYLHGICRCQVLCYQCVAEREGFEPPIRFPVYTLSRRAVSTTHPSLRAAAPWSGCRGRVRVVIASLWRPALPF